MLRRPPEPQLPVPEEVTVSGAGTVKPPTE
jgi:hypothetical protein